MSFVKYVLKDRIKEDFGDAVKSPCLKDRPDSFFNRLNLILKQLC